MLITKESHGHLLDVKDLQNYLITTDDTSWCVDVVQTKNNKNCFFGHLWDWAMAKFNCEKQANLMWMLFEECYASTYMIYAVNDGDNHRYPQNSPKERCLAYLDNLISGKEKTTWEVIDEQLGRA